MNILVVHELGDRDSNPFTFQLIQGLAKQSGVHLLLHGVNLFWYTPFDIDLLNIHEPEALTNKKNPSDADLHRLEQQIIAWKQRARIVVTLNNTHPHYRNTPQFERLYELVFSYADGFTHMGQASLDQFSAKYPPLASRPQTVIPIGSFPDDESRLSRADARKALNLKAEDVVFLSFGTIRDFEELDHVLMGFRGVNLPNKQLIICAGGTNRLRQRKLTLYKLRMKLMPDVKYVFAKIPTAALPMYFNAADVTILPRVKILNSAVTPLAFAFGQVVVGPDTGVVGESLKESGNPVFTLYDYPSVSRALEHGVELSREGHGARNREYAHKYWNWDLLGQRYVEFFESVLAKQV